MSFVSHVLPAEARVVPEVLAMGVMEVVRHKTGTNHESSFLIHSRVSAATEGFVADSAFV